MGRVNICLVKYCDINGSSGFPSYLIAIPNQFGTHRGGCAIILQTLLTIGLARTEGLGSNRHFFELSEKLVNPLNLHILHIKTYILESQHPPDPNDATLILLAKERVLCV